MSENESSTNVAGGNKAAAPASSGTRIIRSRFPKVQPNIAQSSGLTRIRRLSGHFNANSPSTDQTGGSEQSPATAAPPVPSTPPPSSQPPPIKSPAPNATTQSPFSNSPQHHLIESVLLSPRVAHSNESASVLSPAGDNIPTRSPLNRQVSTFRQFVLSGGASSPLPSPAPPNVLSHFAHMPGTPGALGSVDGSIYKPKFTKEQVMNIIKLKAIQKLKQNESENLRERRKKNKKNLLLASMASKTAISESEQQQQQPPTEEQSQEDITQESNTSEARQSTGAASNDKQSQNGQATSIDRSKLRMKDFLYYNPRSSNKKQDETGSEKSATSAAKKTNRSSSSASLATSEADTNDSSATNNSHGAASGTAAAIATPRPSAPPPQIAAPQLKIAEDGTIVINEESLVIQREPVEPVYDSTVVESEVNEKLNYNSYRKFHHSKKWTTTETARFYKALGMVGTDFTMIQKFFAHRSRNEIKRKFKREEKINQALIDKILANTVQLDFTVFVSSSSEGEENEDENKTPNENNEPNQPTEGGAKSTTERKKKSKKSTLSPADNKDGQKKKKLRRVNKRDFVGSESETEKNESNRRGGEYKSRKYISESSDDSSSTQLDRSNASASVACAREQVVEDVTPAITANPQQTNEQSDNEKDANEDADGVELVLDLDSNQVIKIFKNENQNKPENLPTPAAVDSTNTSQNEQNTRHKEEEETNVNCDKEKDDEDDDDEDEDGCLIIDLDKSTITHKNVIVTELDSSPNRHQQLPKSSISITKREPTKKN